MLGEAMTDAHKLAEELETDGKMNQELPKITHLHKTGELELRAAAALRSLNVTGQAGQDPATAPSQEGHAAGPAPAAPEPGLVPSNLVTFSITDKRKYRCPKHGIVTEDDSFLGSVIDRSPHILVTLTPLPRLHCLWCYADWLEVNIPQLELVKEELTDERE